MSSTHDKKPSGYRILSASALLASLALAAAAGCFDDRSLGMIGDGGGGGGAPGTPPAACAARATYDACQAAASTCRWLEPGCGTPPLPRAACAAVAELNCQGDGDCPAGKRCLTYVVNPCAGPAAPGQATCGACGSQERICW
jgi:hypothetical protein